MTRIYEEDRRHQFATQAVHGGQRPEPLTGAVMTPIFQTSTYVQDGIGQHRGYEYSRTQNPTREALERCVAVLEGGGHGVAFASGLAATDAVLKLLQAGDHVVCGENLYGGTFRLMEQIYARLGLSFTYVDTRDLEATALAIRDETKLLFIETPTNPMMSLTDLAACGRLARDRNLMVVVDNTFATPCLQRPLDHGAHVVIHSTTKYLNGHSDVIGGIVVTSLDDVAERLAFVQNASGAVPGPMDCWLVLRGLKTLAVRMRQHEENARSIAEWVSQHPAVSRVYYPGLPSHPQHDLAKRQMHGFGAIISLDLDNFELAKRFVTHTKLFALAESLGGVESLICHPTTMTHAAVPKAMREAMGLTDSLIRLSVGIENVDDLRADLERAFEAAAVPV